MTYQDQDVPIECRNRVVSKTIYRSDNIVQDLIVWGNPRHPIESG